MVIPRKAVARGKARKTDQAMPRIGIDEKAFRKGQNYITLIYDLDTSTVHAISDSNDTEGGNACFSRLSEAQRGPIEAISMDVSAAYVKSAEANIPLAESKIVHNRFRLMKLASEAADKVRRGERRELKKQGNDRLSALAISCSAATRISANARRTDWTPSTSRNSRRVRPEPTRRCSETFGIMTVSRPRPHTSRSGTAESSTRSYRHIEKWPRRSSSVLPTWSATVLTGLRML